MLSNPNDGALYPGAPLQLPRSQQASRKYRARANPAGFDEHRAPEAAIGVDRGDAADDARAGAEPSLQLQEVRQTRPMQFCVRSDATDYKGFIGPIAGVVAAPQPTRHDFDLQLHSEVEQMKRQIYQFERVTAKQQEQIAYITEELGEKYSLIDGYLKQDILKNKEIERLYKALDAKTVEFNELKTYIIVTKARYDQFDDRIVFSRDASAKEQFMQSLRLYNGQFIEKAVKSPNFRQLRVPYLVDADIYTDKQTAQRVYQAEGYTDRKLRTVRGELSGKLRSYSRDRQRISPFFSALSTRQIGSNAFQAVATPTTQSRPVPVLIPNYAPQCELAPVLLGMESPKKNLERAKSPTSYLRFSQQPGSEEVLHLFYATSHLIRINCDGSVLMDGVQQLGPSRINAVGRRINKFVLLTDEQIMAFDSVCRLQDRVFIDGTRGTAIDYIPDGYAFARLNQLHFYSVVENTDSFMQFGFPILRIRYISDANGGSVLLFGDSAFSAVDMLKFSAKGPFTLAYPHLLEVLSTEKAVFLVFRNCIQKLSKTTLKVEQSVNFKQRLVAAEVRNGSFYAAIDSGEIARFEQGDLLQQKRTLSMQSCAACAFGIDRICMLDCDGADKSLRWGALE